MRWIVVGCFALVLLLLAAAMVAASPLPPLDVTNPDLNAAEWRIAGQTFSLNTEATLLLPAPGGWQGPGVQPAVAWVSADAGRTPWLYVKPSPDAAARVIVQMAAAPLWTAGRTAGAADRPAASGSGLALELLAAQARLLADLDRAGVAWTLHRQYTDLLNGLSLTLPAKALPILQRQPDVLGVYPDYPVQAALTPNIAQIAAPAVWAMADAAGRPVRGAGIRVAVIDTGIDFTHPDLGGGGFPNARVVGGRNLLDPTQPPADDHGHGTHVAGIIAANGGLQGVAPQAELFAVKALNRNGQGLASDVIAALEWAMDPDSDPLTADGAHVINLSLGGAGTPCDPLSQAADAAVAAGAVVVAAAGNGGAAGWNTVHAPAAAALALAVGAVDAGDGLASFSGRGPAALTRAIKPDLAAPGVQISSTAPANSYRLADGTSAAAPHVAGAAALLRQLHPGWTAEQVRGALIATALDLGLSPYAQGAGRVQADQASTATLIFSPPTLSLGLADLTKGAWSASHVLQATNLLTTTITATLEWGSDAPAGVSAFIQPGELRLAPGETGAFLFTLAVDNGRVPDAPAQPFAYSGRIIAEVGGRSAGRLPVAFLKTPRLQFTFDTAPDLLLAHNGAGFRQLLRPDPAVETEVLAPAGVYDVAAIWSSENAFGVRSGIRLQTASAIHLSPDQAELTFEISPRDIRGAPLRAGAAIGYFGVPAAQFSYVPITWGDLTITATRFSPMGAGYEWAQLLIRQQETTPSYLFVGGFRGITESLRIETPPQALTPADYVLRALPWTGAWLDEGITAMTPGGSVRLSRTLDLRPGQVHRYYHVVTGSADRLFGLLDWRVLAPLDAGARELKLATPLYSQRAAHSLDDPSIVLARFDGPTVPLGLGPPSWQVRFDNTPSALRLRAWEAQLWPFIGPAGDRFGPQGLPFRIEMDGRLLVEGGLSPTRWSEYGFAPKALSINLPITATQPVTFHTALDYAVGPGNATGLLTVAAICDLAAADPNPPALLKVAVQADDWLADEAANQARVRLAVSDTVELAELTLEADLGGGFVPYPLAPSSDEQEAVLPAAAPGTAVSLRITAADRAGNRLVWTARPAYISTPRRLYLPVMMEQRPNF